MKKIIIVILVCVTNVLVGQVAWQQTAPTTPKTKNVEVDGVTYTLKSDHTKELEMLIAVKNLKKGDELSKEQILTIYEIVLRRAFFVQGTRVYMNRNGVCSDFVSWAYDGLYPAYRVSSISNPIGTHAELEESDVPTYTCEPVPGMPVTWYNPNGVQYAGHVGIVVSFEKSDLGHDWYVLTYYDQNNAGRKTVGLAKELVVKNNFCTFVKTYPYF